MAPTAQATAEGRECVGRNGGFDPRQTQSVRPKAAVYRGVYYANAYRRERQDGGGEVTVVGSVLGGSAAAAFSASRCSTPGETHTVSGEDVRTTPFPERSQRVCMAVLKRGSCRPVSADIAAPARRGRGERDTQWTSVCECDVDASKVSVEADRSARSTGNGVGELGGIPRRALPH